MHSTLARAVTGILLLSGLAGCIPSGPRAPAGWATTVIESPAELFTDDVGDGSLFQLLIGYRRVLGHSAIRLVGPGDQKVFWDPGGGYGKLKGIERDGDVILDDDVPDIMSYMDHRYREIPLLETEFTVMEWHIKGRSAQAMREVLIDGWSPIQTGGIEPEKKFDNNVPTMACATAMSRFLRDHGQGEVAVTKVHVYPHDILYEVWRSHPPVRVISFKRDRTAALFLPQEAMKRFTSD